MIFHETPLTGAYIIEPKPYEDNRGSFARIYCENEVKEIGHKKRIVQINHSVTTNKGAVRGMHYQNPPKAEIKIVKCLTGSVFDVIIDLRKGSKMFLKWFGETISAKNKRMMYIPEGFAHGFQTLDSDCELLYFHTEFYSPDHEGAVRFDDPLLNINWPLRPVDLSERDLNHPLLTLDYKGIDL